MPSEKLPQVLMLVFSLNHALCQLFKSSNVILVGDPG